MKLKNVAIHGFKSFADRTVIAHASGITGVIGPNGSGKSNIIDAVRWVMGEQTAKQLRADDPTDIIFAGSQKRKALSMAEVTLTFTNDGKGCPPEFMHLPEVSIGRRIYRGGEREYFLNKEECRLKDITDFLLAIGVGPRSYCIIAQEKRDRIIQASPQDLREILEETAGITMFKVRRKDAEKRIAATHEKLNTLSELEQDLNRQCEELQIQVDRAREKMELSYAQRDKELALITNQFSFFAEIVENLRTDIRKAQTEVETITVESGSGEARLNELKAAQLDLVADVDRVKRDLLDRQVQQHKLRERVSNQRQMHEERKLLRQKTEKELADERGNLEREEERQKAVWSECELAERHAKAMDAEISAFEEQLSELDETLHVERARIEEKRSELGATNQLAASQRARAESSLEQVNRLGGQFGRLTEQRQERDEERRKLQSDRRDLDVALEALSSGLNQVAHERSALDRELATLEETLSDARGRRDEAKERYAEVTHELSALEKLLAAGEGLSDGAKALQSTLKSYLSGSVFDNVRFHRDDERVMEQAFPEVLQAGIVKGADTLMELLDASEEQQVSRISLLFRDLLAPLSEAEKQARAQILAMPGLRSPADRLERCELPELKSFFERVFLARDEWLMLSAKKCGHPSFLFASDRGASVRGSGELAFGQGKDDHLHEVLQRKRRAEFLVQEKNAAQDALAGSEGALMQASKRQQELANQRFQLDQRIGAEQAEATKLTSAIEANDYKISLAASAIAKLDAESAALEEERQGLQRAYQEIQAQLGNLETEAKTFAAELEYLEEAIQERRDRREEIVQQIGNRRQEARAATERMNLKRQNYEEIHIQIRRLQEKIDRDIASLGALSSALDNAESETQGIERNLVALDAEVRAFQAQVDELVNEEAEIDEEIRVIEGRLKSAREAHEIRKKHIFDKSVELARAEQALEGQLTEAREKFGLSTEQLFKRMDSEKGKGDPKERASLEKELKDINAKLATIGPVNERALEEFAEVSQRRDFLQGQVADIHASAEELTRAIAEIEETTKTRFLEIFTQVNTLFTQLFPTLFPGGHGELHMIDPNDLLNTGVEILVQLPGKRLQKMSAFSGGEKALTAISLIFSLLKTTPAPFCFLDEVDAPLDEANVGRFNDVVEMFSDEFQFTIITHNRRTMEILDQIYGISMVEPGVSKLVSVDLSELPGHLQKKKKEANAGLRAGAASSALAPEAASNVTPETPGLQDLPSATG